MKFEMYEAIEQYLRAELQEEPVDASVLILHSLNSIEKLTAAKACLQTYIRNIITDPTNHKFLRIRCQNKIFMVINLKKILIEKLSFCFRKKFGQLKVRWNF